MLKGVHIKLAIKVKIIRKLHRKLEGTTKRFLNRKLVNIVCVNENSVFCI